MDKNDRGVSAIGCTLRHLAAKVAVNKVLVEMADLLAPDQLGFGVSGGVEATVNSGRLYLHNIDHHQALLKLDFMNAFNSVCRDKLLAAVHDLAPDLFPFVHSSYSSPTSPFWEDKIFQSQEGIQQGDPLGLLFFCLSFSPLHSLLKSEFHVFYLDEISLEGDVIDVLHDLVVIECEAEELGFLLNHRKSEVICSDMSTRNSILSFFPGASVVEPSEACLLGSPIGDLDCVSSVMDEKFRLLRIMGERLQHLFAHYAIFLLCHCQDISMFPLSI